MMLMAADVAKEYHRLSWRRFESARELVDDIDRFMASKGLSGSSISRLDVAEHVLRIQAELAQAAAVAEENVREGLGDNRPDLDDATTFAMAEDRFLAQRVRDTSMAHWGEERIRLGIAPRNTFDHLAGAGH